MKKPRVTQEMLDRAFARKEPIRAVELVRRRGGRRGSPVEPEFIKYKHGQVVFKKMRGGTVLALYVSPGQLVHRGRARFACPRKCRTQRVYVLGRVFRTKVRATRSIYRGGIYWGHYEAGCWFEADGFDQHYAECAKGAHFFETLAEARAF